MRALIYSPFINLMLNLCEQQRCIERINRKRSKMKWISAIAVFIFLITNSIKAQDLTEMGGYYWTEEGEIYSGIHKEFFEDGTLKSSYSILNGELHGTVAFYYPNGNLEERGNYRSGNKDGVWEQWNQDGTKTGEAFYKKGNKDGIWSVWDDNGIQRYRMAYSKNKKVDVWKMWDECGGRVSEKTY